MSIQFKISFHRSTRKGAKKPWWFRVTHVNRNISTKSDGYHNRKDRNEAAINFYESCQTPGEVQLDDAARTELGLPVSS